MSYIFEQQKYVLEVTIISIIFQDRPSLGTWELKVETGYRSADLKGLDGSYEVKPWRSEVAAPSLIT